MPPINYYVVETILLAPERRNEEIVARSLRLLNRTLGAAEAHMEGREFIAGDFNVADTITGHAVIMSRRLGADFSNCPNLCAYADRLEARAGVEPTCGRVTARDTQRDALSTCSLRPNDDSVEQQCAHAEAPTVGVDPHLIKIGTLRVRALDSTPPQAGRLGTHLGQQGQAPASVASRLKSLRPLSVSELPFSRDG